ncbi:MAG: hypothetical protein H6551_12775 [Chitinophagales bacterium]|nr:hypothetical protein [Chitinophagales bacterium]
MELEIAQKIYSGKYRERMAFEYYLSILESGFNLLKREKATKRQCSKEERDAMKMALEYNLESMFS